MGCGRKSKKTTSQNYIEFDNESTQTEVLNEGDLQEFQVFGRQIGIQLAKLPLREALEVQMDIHKMVVQHRVKQHEKDTKVRNARKHSKKHS